MDVGERARAWSHGRHDRICDIRIPWAHGTIVRASAHPEYYDFNLVRVEAAPALEVDELLAVADEALEGLAHRRLDFEQAEVGKAVAPALERHGWKTTGLVLLRHATGVAPEPAAPVEEVDWSDVRELRSAWHQEDFPVSPTTRTSSSRARSRASSGSGRSPPDARADWRASPILRCAIRRRR
jgi:hypothetical protein